MLSTIQTLLLAAPFIIVLLAIALAPLLFPVFWKKNEIKIFAACCVMSFGFTFAFLRPEFLDIFKHSLIDDYTPFIIMLFVLYVISSGIKASITISPTSLNIVIFLFIAGTFSSIIGTTGASMLFIMPFIDMIKLRKKNAHLIVFFIFIVSNVGGLLTPIGDPPLLIGYLHGVDFFWCLKNIFQYWLAYMLCILIVLYVLDYVISKRETIDRIKFKISMEGYGNLILIAMTMIVLFIDLGDKITVIGCSIPSIAIKNAFLLLFALISVCVFGAKTESKINFKPIIEVAVVFFVIFTTIAPVMYIIEVHSIAIHEKINALSGSFGPQFIYFWACGLASSFLDNAPSYLTFFKMAGGNGKYLMTQVPDVLKAISISSVVFGAMTYIGNAPNLMVKAIADSKNIKTPSFLKYSLYAICVILPISLVVSLVM